MKIEFGVQEYFNELKLMDAQYGQEEELYPWVYMLLQMAECRKREILKEWYQGVSIRDVHIGGKAKGDSELKKKIYSGTGFPDMAILDMKATRDNGGVILGCVEIKKEDVNSSLDLKEGMYSKNSSNIRWLIPKAAEIEYFFKIEDLTTIFPEKSKIIQDNGKGSIEGVDEIIEEKVEEQLSAKWECKKVECYQHTNEKRSYKTEISEKKDLNLDIKDIPESLTISIKNKGIKTEACAKAESKWNNNTNLKCKNAIQILSYLENIKKVLYTNGLEFYYLVLNEKKIDVKKIADLQPMYAEYKENTTPSPQLLLEASAELDRLIAGLTSIDWHQPPVAEIPSI